MTALSKAVRASMASIIIDEMREVYEAEGETGDFGDGERHLRDNASDDELRSEWAQWCKDQPMPEDW